MDEDIVLFRTSEDNQTKGTLFVPEADFNCFTLELPWRDNQNNISCIPPAPTETKVYEWVRLERSSSFNYPHIWIRGVPNRTYIKIHRANFASGKNNQLLGCIAVGDGYTDIDGDGNIDTTNSKPTLTKLMDSVGDSGTIKIINQVGNC